MQTHRVFVLVLALLAGIICGGLVIHAQEAGSSNLVTGTLPVEGAPAEKLAAVIQSPVTPQVASTATPAAIRTVASQSSSAVANALCDMYEPNDNRKVQQWWGPLRSEVPITAKLCQGDPEDNYYFDVTRTDPVQITLNLPTSLLGHTAIWLYSTQDLNNVIPYCGGGPVTQSTNSYSCAIPSVGRYIVRLYTDGTFDNAQSYTLSATFYNATPAYTWTPTRTPTRTSTPTITPTSTRTPTRTSTPVSQNGWISLVALQPGRYEHSVVTVSDRVYSLGGTSEEIGVLSQVKRSQVQSGGSLSSWQDTTALPVTLRGAKAAAYGQYIYVTGGFDGSEPKRGIYLGAVAGDGQISSWTELDAQLPEMSYGRGLYHHGAVAAHGYLWIAGGMDGTVPRSEIWRAKINANGTLQAFQKVIQIHPGNALAHHFAGMAFGKLERYAEAVAAQQQALRLNPEMPPAYVDLGRMYAHMGRFDDAGRAYKHALRVDPEFIPAHYRLGLWFLKNGDRFSALEQYKILRKLDRQSAERLFQEIYGE